MRPKWEWIIAMVLVLGAWFVFVVLVMSKK